MKTGKKEPKPPYGTVSFERRKHPRFNVDLPIEYNEIDSSISHTGKVLNISEGGLLLYFSGKMDIGRYIRLKLFLPLGYTIEMLGEVIGVEVHLDKDWRDYRCGVNFVKVSPEDMTKLKNLLASLS